MDTMPTDIVVGSEAYSPAASTSQPLRYRGRSTEEEPTTDDDIIVSSVRKKRRRRSSASEDIEILTQPDEIVVSEPATEAVILSEPSTDSDEPEVIFDKAKTSSSLGRKRSSIIVLDDEDSKTPAGKKRRTSGENEIIFIEGTKAADEPKYSIPRCPVCFLPPSPLAVTRCGHLFCAPCLHDALSHARGEFRDDNEDLVDDDDVDGVPNRYGDSLNGPCPVCRTVLTGGWGRSIRGLYVYDRGRR